MVFISTKVFKWDTECYYQDEDEVLHVRALVGFKSTLEGSPTEDLCILPDYMDDTDDLEMFFEVTLEDSPELAAASVNDFLHEMLLFRPSLFLAGEEHQGTSILLYNLNALDEEYKDLIGWIRTRLPNLIVVNQDAKMEQIPSTIVKRTSVRKECSICLADKRNGKRNKVKTPCNHLFHVACWGQWVVTSLESGRPTTCPICRQVPFE